MRSGTVKLQSALYLNSDIFGDRLLSLFIKFADWSFIA